MGSEHDADYRMWRENDYEPPDERDYRDEEDERAAKKRPAPPKRRRS